jgi:hypothetical protein
MINQFKETLPTHWACALAYGDFSGLEEEDVAQIEAWQDDHIGWNLVSCDEDNGFCRSHDASRFGVLACDCQTFIFIHVDGRC